MQINHCQTSSVPHQFTMIPQRYLKVQKKGQEIKWDVIRDGKPDAIKMEILSEKHPDIITMNLSNVLLILLKIDFAL